MTTLRVDDRRGPVLASAAAAKAAAQASEECARIAFALRYNGVMKRSNLLCRTTKRSVVFASEEEVKNGGSMIITGDRFF